MSRLNALIAETSPIFEEIADSCETISRSIRALNVLTSAGADPEKCIPHLQTTMAAFAALSALGPRFEAIVDKHK